MARPWCHAGPHTPADPGPGVAARGVAPRGRWRAAPRRAPGRSRTPPGRPACARAPAPGPRRRARCRSEVVTSPSLDFAHHDVPVGERRDLGQVGDHHHLGGAGQHRQPAADLDRGLAADPGVDLVEDERRHRVGAGQHHLERQHHPGQLAARGALGERPRRRRPRWPPAAARRRRRRRGRSAPRARRPPARRGRRAGPRRPPPGRAASPAGRARRSPGRRGAGRRRAERPRSSRPDVGQPSRAGRRARPAAARSGRRCRRARAAAGRRPGDQASTSSMSSPYLRVSAISAARRSETVASRAGSDSRPEA